MGNLENLGSTIKKGVLVEPLWLKSSVGWAKLDRVLQEWRRLPRKHGLVDDNAALNQEHIASNSRILLGASNRDKISWEELVTLSLNPLILAVDIDIVWLDAHSAELVQSPLALPNDSALEDNQHEEGEQRVVPVLIQHPKSNTEDLENEERRNSMLLEELEKGWYWNIEGVVAIVVLESLDLLLGGYAAGLLEVLESWLWLGIDGIGEGREGLLLLIPEETALLEEEGYIVLAASLDIC